LQSLTARDKELDGTYERLYEDSGSGKISDERFAKMSSKYELEQHDLGQRIKIVRAELLDAHSRQWTIRSSTPLGTIIDIEALNQKVVNELITLRFTTHRRKPTSSGRRLSFTITAWGHSTSQPTCSQCRV